MRKTKEILKKTMLVILSILIFLVLIEIISFFLNRLLFPPTNPYQDMEFNYSSSIFCGSGDREWNPYTIVSSAKGFHSGRQCNVNSAGFIGPELKKEDTFRIFILGGSTVWGAGATNENKTISAQLQKMLEEVSPGYFEVVNAGEVGYQSTQEFIRTERMLLNYNPDAVIVLDGRNDIYYSYKLDWSPELNHDSIDSFRKTQELSLNGIIYHIERTVLYSKFLGKFSFMQLLTNIYRAKKVSAHYTEGKVRPEAMDDYASNLEAIVQITKSCGIRPILIFQPTLGYGNKHYSKYEQNIVNQVNSASNWYDVLNAMMPLGEKKVLEIGRRYNISAMSLVNIFDKYNQTIYVDSAHYTDFGNELIAKEMLNLLIKEKLSVNKA